MSQLIQLRQRIQAIETIKKITHAMRLISMSTHTRLRSRQEPLKQYQTTAQHLFLRIKHATPDWHNAILSPQSDEPKELYILVGSQKGLCGNFNISLFSLFNKTVLEKHTKPLSIIAVGKKAIDYLKDHKIAPYKSFFPFNSSTLTTITSDILETILNESQPYTHVYVVSNVLKSFFVQRPHITNLIPFDLPEDTTRASSEIDTNQPTEYLWEQPVNEVLDALAIQCLNAQLEYLLFQSLIAEQAARFVSMDSSTRNADNLLEETKLQYNKLRQAKITKELTELVGSQ